MYRVAFSKQAAKDARKLKSAGLSAKAKELVKVVEADPLGYPPAFEALVGNLSGMYSRRINWHRRFVYEIIEGAVSEDGKDYEGTVRVLSMWTHYEGL